MKLSSSSSRVRSLASRLATTSMMSLPAWPAESISSSSMRYDVSAPHLQLKMSLALRIWEHMRWSPSLAASCSGVSPESVWSAVSAVRILYVAVADARNVMKRPAEAEAEAEAEAKAGVAKGSRPRLLKSARWDAASSFTDRPMSRSKASGLPLATAAWIGRKPVRAHA